MTLEELKVLTKGEVVVFTKVDGTKREMHCTLLPEYLPVMEVNTNIKYRPSPTIVTAWDLEQNDWRSFKFESILSIESVQARR